MKNTISAIKRNQNRQTTIESYDKWKNEIRQDRCSWKYTNSKMKISTISQGYRGAIEIIGEGKLIENENGKTIVCIKIRHRRIVQIFNMVVALLPVIIAISNYEQLYKNLSLVEYILYEIAILSVSCFIIYIMMKVKSSLGKKLLMSFEKEMYEVVEY